MNRHLIAVFLLWALLFPVNSATGQLCHGFERSENHCGDPAVQQVRKALLKAGTIAEGEFEFVMSVLGRFYVFTGSDFVFVDTLGEPEQQYVSHLFHVDSGKINVFWSLDRKSKKVFFISYEGKRNDETQGRHVFYLEIPSDDNAWCNDVFRMEGMPQADPERKDTSGETLRDVRLIDVDHDDLSEILCTFEPGTAGKRKTLLFRQEKIDGFYKIIPWKPTYSREFFDTLFRRTEESRQD